MQNDDMTVNYWKKLSVPLIALALFLLSTVLIPRQVLYTKIAFCAVLIIWFRRDFSLHEMFVSYRYGKDFWVPFTAGLGGLLACYLIRDALSNHVFAGMDAGMIQVWYKGGVETTLLYVLRIVLEPVAIELFFRRGMIVLDDRRKMVLTAAVGTILAAMTSYFGPIGILETVISALPLVIVYCWTGDVYTTNQMHLIYAVLINVPELIYEMMRGALA